MSGGKWTAAWAEFTQKKLPAIRTRWAAALPAILVSLTLLFSIWGIFGVRYVVMTSFLTLVFRTRHQQDFRPRELARTAVMMAAVCLAAFAVGRGLWWALALNLVVPFVLVYLLILCPRAGSPVKRMPPGCWSWRSCSAGPSGS